ncbi:MAG: tripartite tricarboxylate transporter permease [Deltaproteobacteria bacterium]|nr:tripartite tricarboxylate transporter permease [Deltaproteobacteria bacterium]
MFDNLPLLMNGFALVVSPYNIILMMVGVFLGILVGVLPGLGAPNGVTLLMPLTFSMNPVSAIILLTSMYWGALYGGSTTSILFNIPGEPSSVATTFDGHPMAKNGRATEALTTAFLSSGFGALFGVVMVTLLSSWATRFALRFSPVEYFTVFMLAFGSFVAFGGGSPVKTIVSLGLGLAWAAIGMDTVSGSMRLTYGFIDLSRGISLLVVVIGTYGIAELCQTMQEPVGTVEPVASKLSPREVIRAALAMPRYWIALLRSACIGVWMGITPGGPTASTFMSYGVGRRFSKAGARFGTGEPEGLVSSEVSDQAAGTTAMLPMLALGLPSSATAAVLLGGLMIWGLTPGPALFAERPDFVWGLIASMYVSNVVCVIMVLTTVPVFAAILRAPFTIIGPLIVVVCLVGAWTVGSAPIDLWLMLAFGAMGYFMSRLHYPVAPLVLAMVLGDRTEDAFRQSMILSHGSLSVFWSNPLAGTIITVALLCFAVPGFTALWRLMHRRG